MSQHIQEILYNHEIPFEVKNNGIHLVVEGRYDFIDYYPTTGKWISRTGTRGFGVRNLLKYIETEDEKE